MKFHERLVYLIDEKGITSRDLMILTDRSPATISNYRTGRTFPDLAFFDDLRRLIPDYNANWLLTETGNPFLEIETMEEGNQELVKTDIKVVRAERQIKVLEEKFTREIEKLKLSILEKLKVAAFATLPFCTQVVRNLNLQLCK